MENHSFLAFMKECVIDRATPGRIEDNCTTARLYKVYEAWTMENNNGYKENKKEVNKILNELGKGEIKKTNGGNTYYKAITLSKEAKQDYESAYYGYDCTKNDIPELDANMGDVEETKQELGLNDSDDVYDFSKEDVNIPNPDELEIGVGLNVTDEMLEKIGLNDIDVNNNENV